MTFGGAAAQHTEAMEVLVFCHEHAAVLKRELPDLLVARSAFAE